MCTTICSSASITGAGKGAEGWFPVKEATVAYDHPAFSGGDHALLLDFTNYDLGTGCRVAVEMDLPSGRALLARLTEAIAAAEASGLT